MAIGSIVRQKSTKIVGEIVNAYIGDGFVRFAVMVLNVGDLIWIDDYDLEPWGPSLSLAR